MGFQPLPAVSSNVLTFEQSSHQVLKSSVNGASQMFLSDINISFPSFGLFLSPQVLYYFVEEAQKTYI